MNIRSRRAKLMAASAAVALGIGSMAHASTTGTSVGVEFGIGGSHGAGGGLTATDIAGVVPTANWNVVTGNSGTVNNLTEDVNGTATTSGVSVTYTTNDTWNNGGNNGFTGANNTLNTGYLDGGSGQTTNVTLGGLTPGATYTLYITSSDQAETNKGGSIIVNGVSDNAATGNVAGPNYVAYTTTTAGNYHLDTAIADANGLITLSTDASNNSRTPINSIEIIPPAATTPLPASAWGGLTLLGVLGALRLARRSRPI